MVEYPMKFSVQSKSDGNISSPWSVSASGYSTTCNIPPDFSGSGGTFSPEDFFILALANCFVGTFKVYAKASRVEYDSIRVEAEMILDKVDASQAIAKCIGKSIGVLTKTSMYSNTPIWLNFSQFVQNGNVY